MDWTQRSYQLSEMLEWKFPVNVLPLTGKIVTARDFGEDIADGKVSYKEILDHNLRNVFEPFGPVAHVDQPARDAEVTFYHPFAFYRLLQGGEERIRNFFQDDDFSASLGISLCDYMDNGFLWFGGCPEVEEGKADDFQHNVTNYLERATSDRFNFAVHHDQQRRELLACPSIRKHANESIPAFAERNETREMIVHQSRKLNSEMFTWGGDKVRMMVRGATSTYVEKWKERMDAGLPLTAHEKKQMEWTDHFLREGQESDAFSYAPIHKDEEMPTTSTRRRRPASDFASVLRTITEKKRSKVEQRDTKNAELPPISQKRCTTRSTPNQQQSRQGSSSSSDTQGSSSASMNLPSPSDSDANLPAPLKNFVPPAPLSSTSSSSSNISMKLNNKNIKNDDVEVITLSDDEGELRRVQSVKTRTPYVDSGNVALPSDAPVMKVLKQVFQKTHRGLAHSPKFSTELTEFDIKSIQKRLITWGFSQKRNIKKNRNTELPKNEFKGLPFASPLSYELVGKKNDSHGSLPFYDLSNSLDERELLPMPVYEFIDTNEVDFEYRNDPIRSLAKTFDIDCESICDPSVGCQPETCPCMKNSSLVNNVVDESRRVNQIIECCSKCPCSSRPDTCPSIVQYRKLKFHVVHVENMGFALRVMQPVQRGEPLLEFTGVRTNYVSDLDSNWAYTSANCNMQKSRKFTGISDDSANFLINPLIKGNAARFICHSYFANASWITLFRGGMKTVDPEAIVYAMEPLEAGELIYINYGKEFGIEKSACRCTQELCHNEATIKRIKGYSWDQGMTVLKERELEKRKRIVEREFQAKQEYFNELCKITENCFHV